MGRRRDARRARTSTNAFWKMPMCAAGPPNAVQPMSTNEKKMSLYVAWTSCEGGAKGWKGRGV